MTHGSRLMLEDGKGERYDPFENILKHFSSINSPHLKNVIKLLVIQACRGLNEQPWKKEAFDAPNHSNSVISNQSYGQYQNTFLAQSTIQNHQSVRFPLEGTPYIQEFCKSETPT